MLNKLNLNCVIEDFDISEMYQNHEELNKKIQVKRQYVKNISKVCLDNISDNFNIIKDIYNKYAFIYNKYLNITKGSIYVITCKKTNLCYIGSTFKTIELRYKDHKDAFTYNRTFSKLHNSFKENNFDNHKIDLLCELDNISLFGLRLYEDYNILQNDCIKNGLNTKLNLTHLSMYYSKKKELNKKTTDQLNKNIFCNLQKQIFCDNFKDPIESKEIKIIDIYNTVNNKHHIVSTKLTVFKFIKNLYCLALKNLGNKKRFKNSALVRELILTPIYLFKFRILKILKDGKDHLKIVNYIKLKVYQF